MVNVIVVVRLEQKALLGKANECPLMAESSRQLTVNMQDFE